MREGKRFSGLPADYFIRLQSYLEKRDRDLKRDFSADLYLNKSICLKDYYEHCSQNLGKIAQGLEITSAECRSIYNGDKPFSGLKLCEYLITKRRDKSITRMACARIVGYSPGHHSPIESSNYRMHIADDGSWKPGPSLAEQAEVARRNAEDRKLQEAGKPVPIAAPPAYTNLRCTADLNEFFEI